ncbi:ADAMTS-like protein 4 [Xenopus laevis]|uniref:ADAMTS-like protein 4 n=2 Tax=Xenopus laevis TaxID=8355 RepID=A0A1L8FBU4_XENLA|nr:ADAMTS-like protein 4 [Xenopus laevis]OCT69063.1 hypothetical protein XELAEV_18040371mg [Xenopus laevis]
MYSFGHIFLSLMIVHLCHTREKVSNRTPRQTEDEGAVNKISGLWGSWGPWSSCSQTCGLGVIERSRNCLSPYKQVPWVPGAEPAPHIMQTIPQPSQNAERSHLYPHGAARPAFPLHTDGEIAAPFVDLGGQRHSPTLRYNPFNRHTRQGTHSSGSQPPIQNRDNTPYHRSITSRGRAAARHPETGWYPAPLETPYLQEELLAPETFSMHRNDHQSIPSSYNRRNITRQVEDPAPWPFFPDSIPLLKPESSEDHNPGQSFSPLTPTKESRFSRRSRVRNSIKPGKYGYGKVPFALPLHKDKEESQRSKRHHKSLDDETTVAPWKEEEIPTEIPSQNDRQVYYMHNADRSIVHSPEPSQQKSSQSHKGESLQHHLSHIKHKRHEHPSWPERLVNISHLLMGLSGFQQKALKGDESKHKSIETDLAPIVPVQEKGLNHRRRKSNQNGQSEWISEIQYGDSTKDSARHGDQNFGSRKQVDEDSLSRVAKIRKARSTSTKLLWADEKPVEQKSSSIVSSVTAKEIAVADSSKIVAQSDVYTRNGDQPFRRISRAKMFGTVKPMQSRTIGQKVDTPLRLDTTKKGQNERTLLEGSVLLTQRERASQLKKVSKHSEDSEITADEVDQQNHQAASDSVPLPRSRSQRQSQNRHGADNSRVFQSLFREHPSIHRPSQSDPWPTYGRSPAMAHEREQDVRESIQQNSELPQWNLYNPGSEEFHCEGEQKQYKSCNQEACPSGEPDARAMQCATFNSQEFMGRLYQWEAFTEVSGNQRCALNCRPVGYRFYVRHTEKVQDGTPCEAGSLDVCVDGQCLSPGCDGILGSNSTLDTCGVCGGDGSTCKFVTGTFKETNVPIGYHKILEIPKGATQIKVKELTWSPNYLALRSRIGKSIINGNWAVDPAGRYEAGGTVFIYTQPGREEQEGETFTAAGPTSEALDVYMIFQQDNPGISFQFFISSPTAADTSGHQSNPAQQEYGALRSMSASETLPNPGSRIQPPDDRPLVLPPQSRQHSTRPVSTLQRNIRIPPLQSPPVHYWPEQPQFFWKRVDNTACSVSCGKGFWYPIYHCVSRNSLEEVSEEECDLSTKPFPQEEACNTQPCPAFWDVGNWSVCSRTCGNGIQHRQVLCRQMYANRTTMVHPQRCSHLVKPNVTETCQLRICSHWEIQSNWSQCSVMCGMGQRIRRVRCVSNQGDEVGDGECSNRLRPRTNEVCDMGPCVRSWFYNEWSPICSAECGTGIQRRSVFCLSSSPTDESQESCGGSKPSDMRVCNSGPCERIIKWYTGPWSECSADCGDGSQKRDVICVSKLGAEFNVTDQAECSHLEKPLPLQNCNLGPCGPSWFTTPWSACSQSCLGGIQMREVRCLASDKTFSQKCDQDSKPEDKRVCNTQPCSAALDENCRDRYHNCAVVVQARLCVYGYYKQACCSSCAHAVQRSVPPESR